eukprot:scaffold598356_cov15-Prasinocladus_malaysianus.AAC.1
MSFGNKGEGQYVYRSLRTGVAEARGLVRRSYKHVLYSSRAADRNRSPNLPAIYVPINFRRFNQLS